MNEPRTDDGDALLQMIFRKEGCCVA